MIKNFSAITLLLLSTQLAGCFPAVVGGATAGGIMAADRRTSGIFVEDQGIELKVSKRLLSYMDNAAHVNVTSYNRVVLLTGEVPSEAQRTEAENLSREITNVREIHNALVVGAASSIGDRSNDAYTTTKVKTRFISENLFPANIVKVVTEANTVYLMGIVSEKEANDAVEIARNTEGVSKVVKVFEYIK
ncbi:BON domain-containing protein [Methylophilus aquaticus]|uniref:BON domain-containing protein n=1 Tax=Methylophilus aquaticus TaxID=1971610 RepID=A0ABT9JSC1_9PROT|nr:BON domain-containing protein [Methylophilus aquaticus]MDP8567454.1 BON domain-containing protein [Methylophilus aquaticus]